jgi:tripartite-type tricarboxylate transporter receptor subunit TctC
MLMKIHPGPLILLAGALGVAVIVSGAALAQASYPSKPVRILVGFAPGGPSDIISRVVGAKMGEIMGTQFVVENKTGAGGAIATQDVARSAPDGYTIDIGQWDTHVGSIIYNINYDLQKDFEPLGLISVNPQLLVGKKNLPANKLSELVTWMKANPGDAKFVNQNAAAAITGRLSGADLPR